ncbi:hypothetical protein J3Q64DRAFT_1716624 [Phycomyces blakesleeanus]|uniref:Uncharacterized protein n=2 Tax=Phycomyces blakesleeanus TaxID=4837 RepID=A0A167QMR3_PHYB8|nr:hypothetical protein PHYBLDRAFT_75728 [Phycomyces blakesleeanus NRRL 1555(-)]OAD79940.1 hypothetical protein PHYBLDRAFT_75728 [Phycomyces blakesleeanus NRRL 1555(-)]|eukprot:XP_018297980.1 hypothetical protein PHYBLDRAFT_75728 [Phycomyces blakesleeanus NRRL 1555(-)]
MVRLTTIGAYVVLASPLVFAQSSTPSASTPVQGILAEASSILANAPIRSLVGEATSAVGAFPSAVHSSVSSILSVANHPVISNAGPNPAATAAPKSIPKATAAQSGAAKTSVTGIVVFIAVLGLFL